VPRWKSFLYDELESLQKRTLNFPSLLSNAFHVLHSGVLTAKLVDLVVGFLKNYPERYNALEGGMVGYCLERSMDCKESFDVIVKATFVSQNFELLGALGTKREWFCTGLTSRWYKIYGVENQYCIEAFRSYFGFSSEEEAWNEFEWFRYHWQAVDLHGLGNLDSSSVLSDTVPPRFENLADVCQIFICGASSFVAKSEFPNEFVEALSLPNNNVFETRTYGVDFGLGQR
jgi:hypothetical protein